MKLYHHTFAAAAILAEGFKDHTGYYMFNVPLTGVWFSDVPLGINEGADGDTYLVVEVPEDVAINYEVIEEVDEDDLRKMPWMKEAGLKVGDNIKGYREFIFPAEVINSYGPPKVESEEE